MSRPGDLAAEIGIGGANTALCDGISHSARNWLVWCVRDARHVWYTGHLLGRAAASHPTDGPVTSDNGRTKQVAGRPPSLPPGFTSLITADSAIAEAARQLEYRIFIQEGFFPPADDGRIAAYGPYESRSIFHVVISPQNEVIGVVRSLLGDYDTLPVGHHAPDRWDGFPSEPVCEYASLAIRSDMRKHLGIAEELYRSVFALAWRSGVSGLVALVDPWLQKLLNDYYGCQFDQLGPEIDLHGFPVRPIGVPLVTLEQVMPERVPHFWAWLVEGIEQAEIVIDLRDRISTTSGTGPPS